MSVHMKKHPISAHSYGSTLRISHHNKIYVIPKKIIEKYAVDDQNTNPAKSVKQPKTIRHIFEKLNKKFTKAGALLKGLRAREGLSQIEFARKIKVTQANLSSMETGRRPIGKNIAKRIEKIFGTNYRYFLE